MIDFNFNDMYELALNGLNRYTFEIVITKRCNSNCQHCYIGGNQSGTISKDIIDIALEKCKQLKSDNWIELFGGEPMLEPDLCIYAAQKAHSMGLKVSMYTNGYWGNSEKLIKIVSEEIKPDFILISVDDYHTIPYEHIIKILKYFDNNNTPKVGISSIKNHNSKLYEIILPIFPKLNIYSLQLHGVGKSLEYEKNGNDFCRMEGWLICPDGDVRMACEIGYNACKAGNIKTLDINNAFNEIKDKFLIFKNSSHLYDYCNKNNINIFDDNSLNKSDIEIVSLCEIKKYKPLNLTH
jgi:pyruvate-formate lyase-activating enzyme